MLLLPAKARLWLKPRFLILECSSAGNSWHIFQPLEMGNDDLSCRLINAACRWNPAKAIGKRLDTSTCAKRRNNGGGNKEEQRRWERRRTRFLGFAWKVIDSKGEVMTKRASVILPKVHWNYSMLNNLKLVLTLDPQPTETAETLPHDVVNHVVIFITWICCRQPSTIASAQPAFCSTKANCGHCDSEAKLRATFLRCWMDFRTLPTQSNHPTQTKPKKLWHVVCLGSDFLRFHDIQLPKSKSSPR